MGKRRQPSGIQMQPYDYKFNHNERDRNRASPHNHEQTHGIEYQDDSLSSINSDEESYLQPNHHHLRKEKKESFFICKTPNRDTPSTSKNNKPESTREPHSGGGGSYKEARRSRSRHRETRESTSTAERLGRLEAMLEQLIKRDKEVKAPPAQLQSDITPIEANESKFVMEPPKQTYTTSMWINKIQEISMRNHWNEAATIKYMESQMSGIIKAWYNGLPSYEFTWPEWKILITKMFPDNNDFVTTLKRLVTRLRQADESVTNYYFSKMYLIEACKITGEDAVSCLIDGLNNHAIQEQAKKQNFLTPESLYAQFLMMLPDYNVDYSPVAVAPPAEVALNKWYYPGPEASVDEEHQMHAPEQQLFSYDTDMRRQNYDFGNSEAHASLDRSVEEEIMMNPINYDPVPKRQAPVHSRLDKRFIKPSKHHSKQTAAEKVCTICFNRGHLARNCKKYTKDAMLCQQFNQETHKSFLKMCYVNDRHLVCLIDTGCSAVTIRQCEVERMDLPIRSSLEKLRGFGGALTSVLGEVDVTLQVDGVVAPVRAMVVPDHAQDMPVLIGQSFLTQKNVEVIFNNDSLTIKASP